MNTALRKVFLISAALAALAGCGSCGKTDPPSPSPAGLPRIYVTINNNDGDNFEVLAEVATTSEQHATGLMNRPGLDPDDGMLFVFDSAAFRRFWMKNTLISLDMIFVDSGKVIVDINHSATPGSLISFTSAAPAKYVLEVVGGFCSDNNIDIGDTLDFDGY